MSFGFIKINRFRKHKVSYIVVGVFPAYYTVEKSSFSIRKPLHKSI